MKENLKEIIVSVSLIVLAVLLLNPFYFWMPDMMVVSMLVVLLGLFAMFAIFILREATLDEREEKHRALAGRNAYLAGAGILTLGILVQGYSHTVDPWLVLTLIAMIMVKIITRVWSDQNR